MRHIGALTLSTPSDTEIAMARTFDAPRQMVFDAMTKPELLKKWFTGMEGWTLAVCDIDFRVGGKYRYVWKHPDMEMGMGGQYLEIAAPERFVSTEKYDESWYPGEAVVTFNFADREVKTDFTLTVKYESKEVRDAVLASPAESGVAEVYDRLARFLASPW